jgi:CoA:oxalate CoA-transferase
MTAPHPHNRTGASIPGPLWGVTVLDLTRVLAGPYCTMILGDLGARIIKIEHPETGDDSRAFGPFIGESSAYFASLNRGKESIALDLKNADDRVVFEKLLSQADLLVENFRPGTMEKLGYGWETLHAHYPRLIYAAASGFGHTGPYAMRAAYDMVVQAMGGIMSMTGHPGQPPVRVGTSIGDITAGLFTAVGVNAALLHRSQTGETLKVDVAMLDCQVAILENAISRYAATGEIAGPIGARHPSITPFAVFQAKDGWIVIAAGNDALFRKLANAIGMPGLPKDERFANNRVRTENWESLFSAINKALSSRIVAEWLQVLDATGVPCSPINSIEKVLADPHVRSRNMAVTTEDPNGKPLIMAGNPIKMSCFVDPETRRPAPTLDQHRASLLAEVLTADRGPSRRAPAMPKPVLEDRSDGAAQRDQLRRFIGSEHGTRIEVRRDRSFIDQAHALADALLSERGEVLGTVLANELIDLVRKAGETEQFELLQLLAKSYAPDPRRIEKMSARWSADPTPANLAALSAAVESPRQELFRRMNVALKGTATLVKLREKLLEHLSGNPKLTPVDDDLRHLLGSWFNRGFLQLERISWNTPASVLEKLIAYEAVHVMRGWEDLRRRLAPDRRCFGFFHPALPEEPLIFVEVALVNAISDRIEPIIRAPLPQDDDIHADTAIFYSISNCQPGLRGVSFGNFLIKQVASDLSSELPEITTFSTLSPIPRFRAWLDHPKTDLTKHLAPVLVERIIKETGAKTLKKGLSTLVADAEPGGYVRSSLLRDALLRLGARYLAGVGSDRGPIDPVARFHLGNGARIERVNWLADMSKKGIAEAHGLMVNYLYDLSSVEANHEAFANGQPVATSMAVAELINQPGLELHQRK